MNCPEMPRTRSTARPAGLSYGGSRSEPMARRNDDDVIAFDDPADTDAKLPAAVELVTRWMSATTDPE